MPTTETPTVRHRARERALSAAVMLADTHYRARNTTMADGKSLYDVLRTADRFEAWLLRAEGEELEA